jgi:thiosulfate/3-mercaptopyruvate sulfurtransferase
MVSRWFPNRDARAREHVNGARGLAFSLALAIVVVAVLMLLGVHARVIAANATALSAAAAETPEPWAQSEVIQPGELAKVLTGDQNARPFVVCVGFRILYEQAHIPGSVLLGPARDSKGLKSLEDAAASWPRDRETVIYCGCCPFNKCPNVRPAFAALKQMGFTHLLVLDIPDNFGDDWVRKGFPIEKSAPPADSH